MLLAVATPGQGQETPLLVDWSPPALRRLAVGVKYGPSRATTTGMHSGGLLVPLARTGVGGGGFLTYRFTRALAVQPELLYMQKGVATDVADPQYVDMTILNLDYVEAPLLARIYMPVRGPLMPNVFGGPEVAWLQRCSVYRLSGGRNSPHTLDDCVGRYRAREYGGVFGGGVDVVAGRLTVVVDARYDLGIPTIEDLPDPRDLHNRTFSASAGFSVSFGPAVGKSGRGR